MISFYLHFLIRLLMERSMKERGEEITDNTFLLPHEKCVVSNFQIFWSFLTCASSNLTGPFYLETLKLLKWVTCRHLAGSAERGQDLSNIKNFPPGPPYHVNSAIQQCILILRCEGTASYQYTEAVAEKYRPIEGERIIERWTINTWKSPQIEFLGCQKRVQCPNLQLGCDSQSGLIQKKIQRTNCELPNMAVTDHNICLTSKYVKLSTSSFVPCSHFLLSADMSWKKFFQTVEIEIERQFFSKTPTHLVTMTLIRG